MQRVVGQQCQRLAGGRLHGQHGHVRVRWPGRTNQVRAARRRIHAHLVHVAERVGRNRSVLHEPAAIEDLLGHGTARPADLGRLSRRGGLRDRPRRSPPPVAWCTADPRGCRSACSTAGAVCVWVAAISIRSVGICVRWAASRFASSSSSRGIAQLSHSAMATASGRRQHQRPHLQRIVRRGGLSVPEAAEHRDRELARR